MAKNEEPTSKDVPTDPLILQIDQIIRQRQEELFHRLSHALESLRAGPATSAGRSGTIGTMETVESLSAVNLQSINKSEDWHNLLHEARLEDCGVKLQSLEAPEKIQAEGAQAPEAPDPRSRTRKAQGARKKRWQVNAIPLLEEEEYEAPCAAHGLHRRDRREASAGLAHLVVALGQLGQLQKL